MLPDIHFPQVDDTHSRTGKVTVALSIAGNCLLLNSVLGSVCISTWVAVVERALALDNDVVLGKEGIHKPTANMGLWLELDAKFPESLIGC